MFSSKYRFVIATVSVLVAALAMPNGSIAQIQIGQLASWKSELAEAIDGRRGFTANIVDQIFSFAELGFQEFETSGYLVELLREHGFTVEEGVAGIPTAWVATWGSGRP